MKLCTKLNFSPTEDSFPIKVLQEAFKVRIEESEQITNDFVTDILKNNGYNIETMTQGKEKLRLVVDESDEFMKKYEDGVIKLSKEKGKMVAQIKENNRFGKKLPIKEEKYLDGPSSLELMNACQLQTISDSLQNLEIQIIELNENLKEVLRGQQNDRLGLYYSGISLFIEAEKINDPYLKKQLLSQSLKSLSDSQYQLILSIQSDIKYLAKREYENHKRQKFNLMNEKIQSINKSFLAIHQSMLMKAGIYCFCGEIESMTCVFNEYSSFIKETIVPNYKLLSQCDISDTGKLDGTWSKRALLLNSLTGVIEQLELSTNEVYIEYKGDFKNESKKGMCQ